MIKNIKKYTSYILIFITIFMFVGCNKNQYENVKEKDVFDMKTATKIVESYFNYTQADKYDEAGKLLEEKAKTDTKNLKPSELKIKGYRISEVTESGGEGDFKVDVIKSGLSKPETQLIEYRIKVAKKGMDYKITEVETSLFKEAFQKNNQIRFRRENNVETFLITDMDGIPKYGYAKNDSGKLQSELIPKNNFGICSLSYSGSMLGITTKGDGTFVGILMIDDTIQTQSANKDKEKDGQSSDNKDASNVIKEKPIGKSLLVCDLLKNTNVESIVFSQDDKLLLIQYNKDKNTCIKVFNTESGEPIPTNFEQEYPLSKVNVVFREFKKDKMIFSVISKDSKEKNNQYVREWELDLKSYKISKKKK
ncbi:putative lipoprotein [Clostridium botulinum C str. Eklund]|nr:putative lipoprotein [Clostridium botulinum C str. Eklund]NEZ48751.1 hypothetical protein [Clostridium botulinum]